MTRGIILAGLVVLNGILGIAVYQQTMERKAHAQIGGAKLDLVSVAGVSNGQTVIYMLDANSGKLIASRIDVSNKQITALPPTDVAGDLRRIP